MFLNKWEQDIFKSYVQVSDDNSRLFQENLELKDEIKKLKLRIENDNKLYKLQLEQIKDLNFVNCDLTETDEPF